MQAQPAGIAQMRKEPCPNEVKIIKVKVKTVPGRGHKKRK
jgi:hypothetical protein